MNYYVIVEGEKTEKIVYEKWIKYVNPHLRKVNDISAMQFNNFVLYAGYGYPSYYEIIDNAIADINTYSNVDRLIIAVDSEQMSYEEKYHEMSAHIDGNSCIAEIFFVIQHFCIETWALGNRAIIPRNPENSKLRSYLNHYNVIDNDPELLLPPHGEDINRSQFALKYLKAAVNEKYRNLSYSKNNPQVLLCRQYFERVKSRYRETNHIASFQHFLTAFGS